MESTRLTALRAVIRFFLRKKSILRLLSDIVCLAFVIYRKLGKKISRAFSNSKRFIVNTSEWLMAEITAEEEKKIRESDRGEVKIKVLSS